MRFSISRSAALFVLLATVSAPLSAAKLYVNLNAPGPAHDGASWTTAYLHVSDAVAAAAPTQGAEIWVAKGTYTEHIVIPSYIYGIQLYGGFAGTETDRSQRIDDGSTVSMLDGNNTGTVVTFQPGAYNVNVLDGFSILHGRGTGIVNSQTGKTNFYGGGILCMNWSSPVIRNNYVSNNQLQVGSLDYSYGAGIAVLGGNPVIDGNSIGYNSSDYGAGVFCAAGTIPRLTNNNVDNNTSLMDGAGIFANLGVYIGWNKIYDNKGGRGVYIEGHVPMNVSADGTHVEYNEIRRNDEGGFAYDGANAATVGTPFIYVQENFFGSNTGNNGSAMTLTNFYGRVSNNTIVNNTTTDPIWSRDTIYAYNIPGTGAPMLVNNIVAYNSGGYYDGTVSGTEAYFKNNSFFSNTRNYYSTNANPNPLTANGNITVDPVFAHQSYNTTLQDYRLSANSPCRDTGDDTVVATTSVDLDGEPRKDGAHVDMGAYEFAGSVTMSFTTQPPDALVNQYIQPYPAVTLLRSNGQVYPHANAIWVTLKPGTGTPGAKLSTYATLDGGIGSYIYNGVATFAKLEIDTPGTGYVLTAQWAGVTVDSQPFSVQLPRRYVTTTGNDANDGSSWAKAKLTPASALDTLLAPGGEVWVAKGTYTGTFTLPGGVKIYGGLDGTESWLPDRTTRAASETILNGGANGAVLTVAAGAGVDTVIDGLTITNGSGKLSYDALRHAVRRGGAVYCYNASPTIRWNHITGNTATQGGGIYAESGSPVIASNIIEGNTAAANFYFAGAGAAVALYSSPASLTGNLIRNNTATGALTLNHPASSAGAILCRQSDALVRDNTITGNTAASSTFIEVSAASPNFVNNILAFNGGPFNASTDSAVTATYNDLYGNGETQYTGPGAPFGNRRNILLDPLFVDRAGGNLRLQDASPCINRGSNTVIAYGEVDLDGVPRIEDDDVDLGAYERRVLNVLSSKWRDSTHISLTYSDQLDSTPAHGAYMLANYTVVDLDNANAVIPVQQVSPYGIDDSTVVLRFTTLPAGHRIRVTVANVISALNIAVNPLKNTTTLQLPVQVTFQLIDNRGVHLGHQLSLRGASSGLPNDSFSASMTSVFGTYTANSTQIWITPGTLTYRYWMDGTDNLSLNETDRTFNLSTSSPQTIVDVTGVDVRTTFNLFVYTDKAVPAGKDVYVTGAFCNWSTTPGASVRPIKLTAPASGTGTGLFRVTETITQFPWAYKYVLIDRTSGAADSTFLNTDNRTMDIRPYGNPPAFVVNDTAGTPIRIEQVARILRITAGLDPGPSPQTDPAYTGLDTDGNGRIDMTDAIRYLRN